MTAGQRILAAFYVLVACALAGFIWKATPANVLEKLTIEFVAFGLFLLRILVEMRLKHKGFVELMKLSRRHKGPQ